MQNNTNLLKFARLGRQCGFTLIEIMIVAAIVAILAGIGYPSYQEQIAKSRRADAQRALMEAEQHVRRYFSARETFEGITLPPGLAVSPRPDAGTPMYLIQLFENGDPATPTTGASTSTFTLRATRTGRMGADRCGDLQVTNTGEKRQLNATSGSTMADCFKAS